MTDVSANLQDNPRAYAKVIMRAASLGDSDAQATLGQLLLDGQGIARDARLALTWFRIAARQGHAMAINMTGRCLEHGWGCEVDLPGAAIEYRRAGGLGLDWGLYNFAQLLTRGRGVEQDLAAAYGLFRQAANLGHAKSMNLLGRFHHEGVVVARDEAQAEHWYRLAALGGDFRGQYNHAAALVRRGRVEEACGWLDKALASATPGFLQAAGPVLVASGHEAIRAMGERYLGTRSPA